MTWLRDNNTHLNEKQTVASPIEPIVSELVIGGKYNFKHQQERLNYIGKNWSGNGY